ncbi:hypothetical protein FKM82_025369 [Ascaphus truei]
MVHADHTVSPDTSLGLYSKVLEKHKYKDVRKDVFKSRMATIIEEIKRRLYTAVVHTRMKHSLHVLLVTSFLKGVKSSVLPYKIYSNSIYH